jgi:hypothetical protein
MSVKYQVLKFEMTEETLAPKTMPMEITLPRFVWLVLAARAKATGKDLGEIFQEVFESGVEKDMSFGVGVEERREAAPAQNAPGGSA